MTWGLITYPDQEEAGNTQAGRGSEHLLFSFEVKLPLGPWHGSHMLHEMGRTLIL